METTEYNMVCTHCGYKIPVEELRARYNAGLGHCPGCKEDKGFKKEAQDGNS